MMSCFNWKKWQMRKNKWLLLILFILLSLKSLAQLPEERNVEPDRKGNFMLSVAFDVIKTDFEDRIGNKLQGGLEVHHFLSKRFGVTIGGEAWTDTTSTYSAVAGVRFYPLKKFFFRVRGLIGVDEISAGAGFNVFLNDRWAAEGILDAYTSGNVAARIGISFLLADKRKPQH